MANVKFFKSLGANVVKFFKWTKAKLAVLFGWISDLWTDTHKQADIRLIAADIGVGAEIIIGIDFFKNILTLNLISGVLYLGLMIIVGAAVIILMKLSKDALDKR